MSETLAILAIDIAGEQHLVDIFGSSAVDRALNDIDSRCGELITRLLGQHEMLGRTQPNGKGRWSMLFRVRAADMPQACAAIESAGCKLLRNLLISVFGAGTGMRLRAMIAVFPLPPSMQDTHIQEAWLEKQLATHPQACQTEADNAAEVLSILARRSVRTRLQPIVRLADRSVVGYEALSLGPLDSPLERPDRLFNAAAGIGCSVEMELLCAELALERTRGKLPADSFLTINLGPEALAIAPDKLLLTGRNEVMFELTEHLPLDELDKLTDAVARLRSQGIGLALDDAGCGFADLETARILRPDIVKLCITVIRNADQGPLFSSAISETTRHLHQFGCKVLAEGVETEAQHNALTACHIELAQGYLYGRPALLDDIPAEESALTASHTANTG